MTKSYGISWAFPVVRVTIYSGILCKDSYPCNDAPFVATNKTLQNLISRKEITLCAFEQKLLTKCQGVP